MGLICVAPSEQKIWGGMVTYGVAIGYYSTGLQPVIPLSPVFGVFRG